MNEDSILSMLSENNAVITAHEVSQVGGITGQAASGILRKMENRGLLKSKKIKAGRSEVKLYWRVNRG